MSQAMDCETIGIKMSYWQAVMLFLFLWPMFFQLSGNVFSSAELIYESYGNILTIPIPFASIFCFVSIAVFLRLENGHFGMGVVFSMFMLMLLCTIISTGGQGGAELSSFVLLVQFILPMFALIMGGVYVRPVSAYTCFEAIALYMLLLIVPLEVVGTVLQGTGYLTPYLYVFSLYQHLHYLPTIFVGLYFFAAVSLYDKQRLGYLVLFLAPWVGMYIAASLSLLAAGVAVLGSALMVREWHEKQKKGGAIFVAFLTLISVLIYFPVVERLEGYTANGDHQFQLKTESILKKSSQADSTARKTTFSEGKIVVVSGYREQIIYFWTVSLQERFKYWEYYKRGVFESPKIFLFGHHTRPDRSLYPSASNYYLDLLYNFGLLSLLPFFYLIFATLGRCWKVHKTKQIKSPLLMLMAVVFFCIFIENFLQVSFRQPYPGMIMFFLWGMLLSEVSNNKSDYE